MFWIYLIGCCVYGIIDAQVAPLNSNGSIFNTQQNQSLNTQETGSSPALQNSHNKQEIIENLPGPPRNVQAKIDEKIITFTWTDDEAYDSQINSYSILGRTNWNSTWVNISHGVYTTEIDRYTGQKKAKIENILTPWTTYEFKIAAWNSLGMGPASAPSPRYSTPADRPYIAPYNIGGGGGKIGNLTITWAPLKSDEQNGPEIFYKVFWRRRDDEVDFQSLELKEFGNIGTAVVTIPFEYYYTQYVVKVQAINSIGAGPISSENIIYSAEDMPFVAPQSVIAKSFNSTALNISWVPVEQTRETIRGKLIGHRIKYWKYGTKEDDSGYFSSPTTRPWALLVDLEPDTLYFVRVFVYNSGGEGPESDRYIGRTYRKAPQKPPTSVRFYRVNSTTVKLIWRYVEPTLEEEPLKGYKIRVWEIDQDISRANDTIKLFGGKLEAYVDNLLPGKMYKVGVLAFSNGGDGPLSSPEQRFSMFDS